MNNIEINKRYKYEIVVLNIMFSDLNININVNLKYKIIYCKYNYGTQN